ncbi:MAG: hypothetical protein J7J82_00720 [Staphylothermus sp.]|nr:hypothetical protein [Staphylothermus sp.]
MTNPTPPPPAYPRASYPYYYYYPIEGTVYNLQVMGDEVLLNTSNGTLRYRIRGMSVKYMRVPSPNTRLVVFALVAIVMVFTMFMGFGMFSSPFSLNFGSLFTLFMIVFVVMVIVIMATAITAYTPKPVLVVIDDAGVEHYYLIHRSNREKIIQLVTQYRPRKENVF